jgi:hypothetical protein
VTNYTNKPKKIYLKCEFLLDRFSRSGAIYIQMSSYITGSNVPSTLDITCIEGSLASGMFLDGLDMPDG